MHKHARLGGLGAWSPKKILDINLRVVKAYPNFDFCSIFASPFVL